MRKRKIRRRGTIAALTACDVSLPNDDINVCYSKNIIRIIISYHTMNSVVDLCM